jgi:hypothetical protein
MSLALAGCNGTQRVEAPPFDADAAVEKAFADYDTNHDGLLDGKELEACPALKSALERIDTNRDKRISQEELQARFQGYADSKIGAMAVSPQFILDDKPLTGATVDLQPEAFMGSGIEAATGTTDDSGRAGMKRAGSEQPGIRFGCYQVRVSKKDPAGKETIPARYNAATRLGFEIGPNIRGNAGTVFKLSSK